MSEEAKGFVLCFIISIFLYIGFGYILLHPVEGKVPQPQQTISANTKRSDILKAEAIQRQLQDEKNESISDNIMQ